MHPKGLGDSPFGQRNEVSFLRADLEQDRERSKPGIEHWFPYAISAPKLFDEVWLRVGNVADAARQLRADPSTIRSIRCRYVLDRDHVPANPAPEVGRTAY